MKQSTASNWAITLAALAWPLAAYGVLSQLADYSPSVPREVIEAHQHEATLVLAAGMLCWVAAIFIAGYAFSGAKVRSVVASVACLALPVVAVVSMWM